MKKTIVLTGSTGLVGHALSVLFAKDYDMLLPTRRELDITNEDACDAYFQQHTPDVVIHTAAFTDTGYAEKERGNTDGVCWRVNVKGTKYITSAASRVGSYCIFLSTGSVFSGTVKHPGPFAEQEKPATEHMLSWYGYTKAIAEECMGTSGAIFRLSHPLISHIPDSLQIVQRATHPDYLQTLVRLYTDGKLYPLFTDQVFPLTDIFALSQAIRTSIDTNRIGIFHPVSSDTVSPYELMMYALARGGNDATSLHTTTFDAFITSVADPLRYTKYCALDGRYTQQVLSTPSYTWKEIVDAHVSYYML